MCAHYGIKIEISDLKDEIKQSLFFLVVLHKAKTSKFPKITGRRHILEFKLKYMASQTIQGELQSEAVTTFCSSRALFIMETWRDSI